MKRPTESFAASPSTGPASQPASCIREAAGPVFDAHTPTDFGARLAELGRLLDQGAAPGECEGLFAACQGDLALSAAAAGVRGDPAPSVAYALSAGVGALALLDAEQRILETTPTARRLLSLDVGDQLRTDRDATAGDRTSGLHPRRRLVRLTTPGGRDLTGWIRRLRVGEYPHGHALLDVNAFLFTDDIRVYLEETYRLTPAEIDILELTLERETTAGIAERRNASINTVRTQLNRIIRKFDANSIFEVSIRLAETLVSDGADPCDERGCTVSAHCHSNSIWLNSGEARIDFCRAGDPEGEPLIILHALEYPSQPPTPFLKAAARHGFKTIMPLRDGFGASRSGPLRCPDALRKLLQKLDVTKATALVFDASVLRDDPTLGGRIGARLDCRPGSSGMADWLRGLFRFAQNGADEARFAAECVRHLVRSRHVDESSRRLFGSNAADLAFATENAEETKLALRRLSGISEDVLAIHCRDRAKCDRLDIGGRRFAPSETSLFAPYLDPDAFFQQLRGKLI